MIEHIYTISSNQEGSERLPHYKEQITSSIQILILNIKLTYSTIMVRQIIETSGNA